MLLAAIQKVSLFHLLHRIDVDLADGVQSQGCAHCDGPLHDAHYPRKPRGCPVEIPRRYERRLSKCCGEEGCRRRSLPPSVLFMGRRVFWAPVILVVTTLRQQRSTGSGAKKLKELLGVSKETLERWMRFYREVFPASESWRRVRGLVGGEVRDQELPSGLLEQFMARFEEPERAVAGCLRFLATGSSSLPDRGA